MVAKTMVAFRYGKNPEKTGSSCVQENVLHAFPVSPPGVPRERCPFSGRVGEASTRVLKASVVKPMIDRALPYPELEHFPASDTFFAYVNSLARRFLKHRSLAECSVLPDAFG